MSTFDETSSSGDRSYIEKNGQVEERFQGYEPSPEYERNYEWEYTQPLVTIDKPIRWYFTDFKSSAINYVLSMFPVLQWIHKYNLKWLWGDLIAGITVGIVVVPQGMSYAKIAGLPVQYGLYSSFMGVMLYCFFATSKDVSIGPVAVMSAEVYKITHRVIEKVPGLSEKDLPSVAGALSLICGGITLGIGVLRLGFIFEYIPMPAVLGFMSGSAFTIAVGQVPTLMGINKLLDTKAESYKVVINTLKNLKHTNVNAAFGLVCLFVLYALKFTCSYLEKKDKKRRVLWFYLGTMRAALVIIFSTLISWGCYRIYGPSSISIIKTVPRGLTDVGNHTVSREVAGALGSELPVAVIILVLEHIAIAKSFGRINEYRVNPNQELIAIGVSNMIGHFFQAYPNTGSFSRTALKSKCGVRTPLAGIFTGACVLIAIYALTDAFYFISNAALSAIIIHAVGDLISSYKSTYKFYLVAPIECLIFIVDVFLCVFVSLETGIYFSVCASVVNLLLKQTFPLGEFLGKVEISRHVVSTPQEPEDQNENAKELPKYVSAPIKAAQSLGKKVKSWKKKDNTTIDNETGVVEENEDRLDEVIAPTQTHESALNIHTTRPIVLNPGQTTTKWWPLNHDNINPGIRVVPPPPGILVYRFRESLTYQNIAWQTERIVDHVRATTRRNMDISQLSKQKVGDRSWNDPSPRKYKEPEFEDTRPVLRALVFDMSCSPNVDLTASQSLWDLHQELTKYACSPVEFHFAGILSAWSRRALAESGFGGDRTLDPPNSQRLIETARAQKDDLEAQIGTSSSSQSSIVAQRDEKNGTSEFIPIIDTNHCFFHFDIPDLVLK